MTDYERGYKDGMAGAALPNIIDNGDKIDGYAYSYKTDSDGVPYINIDCVRAMLNKAADVQPIDAKEILKHLDALMICVGNAYDTSHYLLESDMAFIEKQEKFIRELLSDKI